MLPFGRELFGPAEVDQDRVRGMDKSDLPPTARNAPCSPAAFLGSYRGALPLNDVHGPREP